MTFENYGFYNIELIPKNNAVSNLFKNKVP